MRTLPLVTCVVVSTLVTACGFEETKMVIKSEKWGNFKVQNVGTKNIKISNIKFNNRKDCLLRHAGMAFSDDIKFFSDDVFAKVSEFGFSEIKEVELLTGDYVKFNASGTPCFQKEVIINIKTSTGDFEFDVSTK